MHYEGPERRGDRSLSDEQMESIAEKAAEKALEKVYSEIGKSIVKKLLWMIGAGAVALVWFLGGKGIKL